MPISNPFKRERSLSELEEATEHEQAEVSLLRQRVMKRQLEQRLGKGGLKYFKDKNGIPVWVKVRKWLESVGGKK